MKWQQADELEQMGFIPKCRWTSAPQILYYSEECHARKTYCFVAYAYSMVGIVESANDSRMKEKKQSKMGRYGRKQWRSGKNSMGSFVRKGKYNYNVGTLLMDLAKGFETGMGHALQLPAEKSTSTL